MVNTNAFINWLFSVLNYQICLKFPQTVLFQQQEFLPLNPYRFCLIPKWLDHYINKTYLAMQYIHHIKQIYAIEIDWEDNDSLVYEYFQDICCHILHKIGLELSFVLSFWNSVMQILQWNSIPLAYIFHVNCHFNSFCYRFILINDKMMAFACG